MVCASLRQKKQKQTILSRAKEESSPFHSCMIKCSKTSLKSRLICFFLRCCSHTVVYLGT